MAKRKPVTLFSKYESVKLGKKILKLIEHFMNQLFIFPLRSVLGPATDLDDFRDIVIEPTIDAFSKMSIFIGNKKYKEDFI